MHLATQIAYLLSENDGMFSSPSGDHAFSNLKLNVSENFTLILSFRPLQGIMHLATYIGVYRYD